MGIVGTESRVRGVEKQKVVAAFFSFVFFWPSLTTQGNRARKGSRYVWGKKEKTNKKTTAKQLCTEY